jgi:hypothetical protein
MMVVAPFSNAWFVLATFRASLPYPLDEDDNFAPYLRNFDTHVPQNLPLALDKKEGVRMMDGGALALS